MNDLTVSLSLDPAILWAFAVIGGLLLLKLILGVAGAVRDGTFAWRELPAILRTNVLPYLIPLAAMAALSIVMPTVKAIYFGSAALYVAKLVADVKDGIAQFYGLSTPPVQQPPAN